MYNILFYHTLNLHNPTLRAQSERYSVTIDDENLYIDTVYFSYKENKVKFTIC
jgi:hypothetical protein